MKKRCTSIILPFIAALLLYNTFDHQIVYAKSQKTYRFNLSHMFPPVSVMHKQLEDWVQKIDEDSNGRIKINIFSGSSLLAPPDLYQGVANGVAQIGAGFFYGDRDTRMILVGSTFLCIVKDQKKKTEIYHDMFEKFDSLQKSFEKCKLLWQSVITSSAIHTREVEVHTLEDLKGLELRSPTRDAHKALAALGAVPVEMSPGDAVVGITKGIIAGLAGNIDQLLTYKIARVVPYTTRFSAYQPGPYFVVMNKNAYEKLPDDLKKVIDESTKWAQAKSQEMWDLTDASAIEYSKSINHKFINLSKEEEKRWDVIINAELAAECNEMGLPGTEVLEYVRQRNRSN